MGSGDVAVFFGSQTGTAEEVAWDLARDANKRGLRCDPISLEEVSCEALCDVRFAVFVVATTGQGDPPVNMRRFWQQMTLASLPASLLAGLRFTVFGLGDSHYREFNYSARKLHARLQRLGAEPFFRLGLGDEQHDFGVEQELDPWAEGMWEALASLAPLSEASPVAQECRYVVEDCEEAQPASEPSGPLQGVQPGARVCDNSRLSVAEAEQDVRNVRLASMGAAYEAGDVCVVWPEAEAAVVRRFIVDTLSMDPLRRVRICPRAGTSPFPRRPLTLQEVFSSYVDISAVPTRHFFHVLSKYTEHELHQQKLSEFASRTLEAKDALYEYCKREKRSAAEVMWDFWTARPPLAELLSALPPMRPRRYSIASSPSWHGAAARELQLRRTWLSPWTAAALAGPAASAMCAQSFAAQAWREWDLCVAVVRFMTKTGRDCSGLCSSFLQQSEVGGSLRCSFEKGALALPPPEVPLIMVCPGTGLSPCRALVQERHLLRAGKGPPKAKDLMFLGFRHQAEDYLYGDEWATFEQWLAVHVAFSRDDPERKVYVQDSIEEHGEHVCQLLDAGARIYVCGRSHPMPAQVFDAFCEALQTFRGVSLEQAAARLRELQRSLHYICDTWG